MRFTVKLGGSLLEDPAIRLPILDSIARLGAQGHEVLLVHGGGKALSRRLAEWNLPSSFVEGLRVTDAPTLEAAVMVLAGEVNKKLVTELGRTGARGVGICGADGGAVRCVPVEHAGNGSTLGYVGRPVEVDSGFFEMLLRRGLVPVVSSLAADAGYQLYNINADQMAAACAWGSGSQALVFLTDVPGVLGRDGKVAAALNRTEIKGLRDDGVIQGGMLPKTSACLEALDRGVGAIHIVGGSTPGILDCVVNGTLTEGTYIHGDI